MTYLLPAPEGSDVTVEAHVMMPPLPHTQCTGVSVNLAVTYLLPAPEGSDVTVEARVVRAGKSLATIQV